MSKELIDRLRNAAKQHPLDAPLELFNEAADALEAKAAPAGEREAFDQWYRNAKCLSDTTSTTFIDGAFFPYKAFQAGAAYQRAQQPQSAEAVAWHTEDHLDDKSATTYSKEIADRWAAKGWPVTPMFYTTPQPSAGVVMPWRKDESKYRGTGLIAARQWNACLDEFARLNGKEVGRG